MFFDSLIAILIQNVRFRIAWYGILGGFDGIGGVGGGGGGGGFSQIQVLTVLSDSVYGGLDIYLWNLITFLLVTRCRRIVLCGCCFTLGEEIFCTFK